MVTDELQIHITADTGSAAQNITNTANALSGLGDAAQNSDAGVSDLVRMISQAAQDMTRAASGIAAAAQSMTAFQTGAAAVTSSLTGLNFRFDTLNSSVQQSYLAFDGAASSVSNLAAASEQSARSLQQITSFTTSFNSQMGNLQQSTQGTAQGMDSLQQELLDTIAVLKTFSGGLGDTGRELEELQNKISGLGSGLGGMQTGMQSTGKSADTLLGKLGKIKGVLAGLGVIKFMKDSNDAYKVQMQNELKLTAHMKQRMNATDAEIQSIKDLASAQQQIGIIGDEIQLAGAQQLTTYAKQSSTLKTLIPAMNNLIAQNAGFEASTSDATSAADMLGRALNGQYTSLKRMGVVFTEAQEQVLKYGTEEQKAAVLADAINSKVGNMNEILAQTPTGKMKQLQNTFGDLQEQLGATFQPLTTAFAPLTVSVLEAIAPPIITLSRGISVLGSVIIWLVNNPFVRFIAITAGAVAIINKLRAVMSPTALLLTVLGVALSGFLGALTADETDIGKTVQDAMNAAGGAAYGAGDAVDDFGESLEGAEKKAAALAGFDTITKLSGGTTNGKLVDDLIGKNGAGLDALKEASDAAYDLNDAFSGIEVPNIDFGMILNKIGGLADDVFKAIFGTDSEQYAALNSLTDKISVVFGEPFTEFWQGVGKNIYDIFNGDESQAYKGWVGLRDKIEDIFGTGWVTFWQGVGANIEKTINGVSTSFEHLFSAADKALKGDFKGASQDIVRSSLDFLEINPYLNSEQKDAVVAAKDAIDNDRWDTVLRLYDENVLKPTQSFFKSFSTLADPRSIDFSSTHINADEQRFGGTGFYRDRYDVSYDKATSWALSGGLPDINVTFALDGEEFAQKTVSLQDAAAAASNGK